jgi:hypothetical protein
VTHRSLLTLFLLATLAACAAGSGSLPASVQPAAGPRGNAASELYVANRTSVTVYPVGGTKLSRTITSGIDKPDALAVDSAGNLYVANSGNSTVTVYALGSTSIARTIRKGVSSPRALALDRAGNLYVANKGYGSVTVFAAKTGALLRSIKHTDPHVLIFDRLGRLYVGNPGLNEITVYRPNTAKLIRRIHTHNGPLDIAVGLRQFLFCVNNDSVTVYSPGATRPSWTISAGIALPSTLALHGNFLYVGNWGFTPSQSTVSIYTLTNDQLVGTIHAGVSDPLAMVFDSAGNLFVANAGYSTISVYAAPHTAVIRKITAGIEEPKALAIGP